MQTWHQLLVAGLAIVAVGCGRGRRTDVPATVPVTAQVTYQDKPVEGATVSFVTEDGHSSSGITDARGIARPWTFDEGDGVVPGNYMVTVRKTVTVITPQPHDPTPQAPSMEPLKQEVVHHLPERYSTVSQSGLTANVSPDGAHEFSFKLTD